MTTMGYYCMTDDNTERPHEALGYRTPHVIYFGLAAKGEASLEPGV
ncbi:MAG: hypothetical protein QHH14_12275 [Clostridiales bacterium]|nr:hypothetical protein [Clostridiales bacterium]